MPSGAKKRKSAKKKNQNQPNNHSDSAPAHTHGDDDDVMHQEDGEGSNVVELSSPASEDHEKPPVQAEAGGASSMEGSTVGNGEAEKEIKIEDESGVKHGIIDHDEANRKLCDGGSSSSGSCGSSSDDESRGIKRGEAEPSVASTGSVAMDDSLSAKLVEPVYDSQAAISVAPDAVEPTLEEIGGKEHGTVEERTCTSVEGAGVGSAESTPKTFDRKECVTKENDNRSPSPRVDLDGGEQRVKDSVATQPFQKTSWKSCCGLFEVFSGSGN
ncbi:hypothetical protein AAHA92_11585 [Salvia divinorum]|uniref:Uncharacterized protein n=1 Tax=Salvia divinorum TaxID=28513 RepID=A0ABD1HHY8_SALDI